MGLNNYVKIIALPRSTVQFFASFANAPTIVTTISCSQLQEGIRPIFDSPIELVSCCWAAFLHEKETKSSADKR